MEGAIFDLPLGEDYDQHYRTVQQIRTLPSYECYEDSATIVIDDPIWGEAKIGNRPGDRIFTDLYVSPLVQRMSGVEQLTLPKQFATMPGSVDMARWEHAWGSVVFVRKMIEKAEAEGRQFDDRTALQWQLRTFVSDIGHTAFSHLGDWLFQGFGGSEDQHDEELLELLEAGGVNDILRAYGFDPQEIVSPGIQDWIECKSPDLCVDRVDYGAREVARWVGGYEPSKAWLSRFKLDSENRLVMSNYRAALYFGVTFGLLATEHWGHPTHRLQEHLFAELVKAAVVEGELPIAEFHNLRHPKDLMYAIDQDILVSTRGVGDVNYDLYAVMLDIARAQRKIFAYGRETELDRFLLRYRPENRPFEANETDDFPDPLEARCWTSRYTGLKPHNIAFIVANSADKVSDFGQLPYTFDMFLPAFKGRSIDPLFLDEAGQTRRLSEHDSHYTHLLAQQQAIQKRDYVARLYAEPSFLDKLKTNLAVVQADWEAAMKNERAPLAKRQALFRDMGGYAIGLSSNIRLYGG